MDAHAVDASAAGRALALRRWAPEARLADAVETVVSRSADLDDTQRAEVLSAITGEGES